MSNEQLCEQIKHDSLGAIEKLYQQNINLLYSLIHRFRYQKEEMEDLLSCAKIGLIQAAKNYNISYGFQFTTYAVPLILGEIKKYFRENSSLHISRSVRDTFKKILDCQEELEKENSKGSSLNDVALRLGIPLEEVLFAYESQSQMFSLDAPLKEDQTMNLGDIIHSEEESELHRELSLALDSLDKKERLIIQMRYYDGLTQQEVASRFFMSQVQVSRIEKKVLEKLKAFM